MTAIVKHKCVGNEYCEICLEDMAMTKRTGWNGNEASREERQEPIVSANCKFCGEDHLPSVKPMTEQAENELICEKLLGWTSVEYETEVPSGLWHLPDNSRVRTPTFTEWQSAGLILEAMSAHVDDRAWRKDGANGRWFHEHIGEAAMRGDLNPSAIRSAALAYLRATE